MTQYRLDAMLGTAMLIINAPSVAVYVYNCGPVSVMCTPVCMRTRPAVMLTHMHTMQWCLVLMLCSANE